MWEQLRLACFCFQWRKSVNQITLARCNCEVLHPYLFLWNIDRDDNGNAQKNLEHHAVYHFIFWIGALLP